MVKRAKIIGTGSYVPEKILDNKYFESIVETSDEWIVERTGIHERRIARDDEAASEMTIIACRNALDASGIDPKEIGLILIGTISGDHAFPATSCIVQNALGCTNAGAFDIGVGCTGMLAAINTGAQFIETGKYKNVICVGVDKLSMVTDYTDRNTCILFGDGASAVILGVTDNEDEGVLATQMMSDGSMSELLTQPAGGSRMPASVESVEQGLHFLKMEGKEVFKNAVRAMVESGNSVLYERGFTGDDVAMLIPHQANLRIMKATAKRLGIPEEKVKVTLHKYGNTSAGTVGVALDEAVRTGEIKKGDLILFVAFGAGLASAGTLVRWAY